MKNLLHVLLILFPILVLGQTKVNYTNDLNLFTTPFTITQVKDNLHDQIFFDSLVIVTPGVSIQMPIRKEICKYSDGSVRFIRYYNGTEPFGDWVFFSKSGQKKYALSNQKESIYFKTFANDTTFHKIQKFKAFDDILSAECQEHYYYSTGIVKAYGSCEPIMVISHFELLETGKWYYFFPSGRIKSKGKFKGGNKQGKWFYYNQFGKKTRRINFKDGEIISQKKYVK